jgi:exosortase
MAAGAVWYFGGYRALGVAAGALGFLVFMIPWPTTLVERLAFPLQLTSSAYAALLGGLLGLPIVRDGVHLHVVPNPDAAPVYSVLVAKQCSGLTSLMVLLALGYLIAYHTRAGLGWRALLLALVVPLALFGNAIRITFVLLAGTYHSAALAQWVHDHESYVLIVLCCMGLLGLRHAILSWTGRPHGTDEKADGQASIISA